jgi:hypothetical protein
MRSVHDLATAVMRRLAAIDQNEQPSAAERAQLVALYDDKYAELSSDGEDLVYWENSGDTDAEEIPNEVFGALTRIMAEEFAPTIGQAIPSEQEESGAPLSIGVKGMRMLRRHVARQASGVPTKIHSF